MAKRTKKKKKEDPKLQDETSEVSKDAEVAKSEEPKCRIIWLYGPNQRVVQRTALALLDNYNSRFDTLRTQLGLPLDQCVIPVFSEVRKRTHRIRRLIGQASKDDVILIVGSFSDKDNELVQKLYQGEAVFALSAERQFYIDNLSGSSMTYKQAKAVRDECETWLKNHFNTVIHLK